MEEILTSSAFQAMKKRKSTGRNFKDLKKYEKHKRRENRQIARVERRQEYRNELTQEERLMVFKRYGFKCYLCGKYGANTIDHVVPLIKGGTNDLKNLRPAHDYCNREKGNKILILPEEMEEISGW